MCGTISWDTISDDIIFVEYDIYLFRIAKIAGKLIINKNLDQREIDHYIRNWALEKSKVALII